uniref:Telomeric single stranded DNA binding POT1/Cdc13 domain-containing protein n=1 Tax=Pseudo-nitzschia australis TaxID=44445 RepID=A0A7S4EIX9_9STRA
MKSSSTASTSTNNGREALSLSLSPKTKHAQNHSKDKDGDEHDKHENNSNDEALGSGLATFFGDFFPCQTDVNGRPIGFSTNLSRVNIPTQQQEQQDHNTSIADAASPGHGNYNGDANFTEAMVGVKYVDGGLTHEQWRTSEKKYLTEYLNHRLHPQPSASSVSSASSSTSSSSLSHDQEEEGERMEPELQLAMETQESEQQQPFSPPGRNNSLGENKKRNRRRRRRTFVPCIEDCLHDPTKLEYLDLYTRTLTLNLSRIHTVWRLRDTRRCGRGAFAKRSIAKPVFERCAHSAVLVSGKRKRLSASRNQSQLQLQRPVFEETEEDGPVAAIYQKVVHFDVEQLRVPVPTEGGEQQQQHKHHQQRIKVFFYNSYATAVSEWIEQQQQQQDQQRKKKNRSAKKNGRQHRSNVAASSTTIRTMDTATSATTDVISTTATTDIVMSLSNVPAICIFPFGNDPRNWRGKQELVDYCLCIGDESMARDNKSHQRGNKNSSNEIIDKHIRFDSAELEIRLMPVVSKRTTTTTTTTDRTTTAVGSIITSDTKVDLDTSSELILSRRALEMKDSLVSSADEGPRTAEALENREHVAQETSTNAAGEIMRRPLQQSWDKYTKHRNNYSGRDRLEQTRPVPAVTGPNQSGIVATTSDRRQSTLHPDRRPPLQEQNQQVCKEAQSRTPNQDYGVKNEVEPMLFTGVAQRMDSPSVHYARLVDISDMVRKSMDAGKGCNLRVNLYASVVTATPPRMTKRGDWVISATLIDDSYQALPMTINVFCKEKNRLPQLVWMGDVIRIHRAGLEIWNEKIQLVGLKPTQYVVIRKVESTWQACPTALNNFAFNPSDIERSQALWRWAKQHHSKENQSIGSDHRFTLAELHKLKKEDDNTTFQNRDITVMVIEKLSYQSSGVLPQGLLRVWDGTGNPPSDPLFMQSKILPPGPGEQREMAYARVLDQVMRASQQLQASLDFDNMGVPISLCGCASNVVVWEKAHWDLIHQHIPVGTFLRLRNVDTPQRWDGNEFRCKLFTLHVV